VGVVRIPIASSADKLVWRHRTPHRQLALWAGWLTLVALQGKKIVPSQYTANAKAAGLDIITWTLERSGTLTDVGGFYFQTVAPVINKSGDYMNVLDVLARGVGILGVFSVWPGTVTYYAARSRLPSLRALRTWGNGSGHLASSP